MNAEWSKAKREEEKKKHQWFAKHLVAGNQP